MVAMKAAMKAIVAVKARKAASVRILKKKPAMAESDVSAELWENDPCLAASLALVPLDTVNHTDVVRASG